MVTVTDFRALKAHPYCEELDIDTIFQQPVPSFSKPSEYVQDRAEDIEIAILNRKSDLHTVVSDFLRRSLGGFIRKDYCSLHMSPESRTMTLTTMSIKEMWIFREFVCKC